MRKILAILVIITTTNLVAQPEGGIGQFMSVYFKHNDSKGINKDTDWKWIQSISKTLDVTGHFEEQLKEAVIETLKKDGKHNLIGFSYCHGPDRIRPTYRYDLLVEGMVGLNQSQTDIIITCITRVKLDRRTLGLDEQQRYGYIDRINIVDIKPDIPVTKENITTDFLKPLRDKRKQITDDLGL